MNKDYVKPPKAELKKRLTPRQYKEVAILAGGCFWGMDW